MNLNNILFRAKKIGENRWVYGYYYYSIRYESHYIKVSENIEDTDSFVEFDVEVIPETIGIFTGVNDMNGNKIFTGDIINNINGNFNAMVYLYSELGKFVVGPNEKCMTGHVYSGSTKVVIGNIYDNHELMDGDKVKYVNYV